MQSRVCEWIFTLSALAMSCNACVRGIRRRASYKVEKGDDLVMEPTPSPCDFNTNCTFQDFRWYRGDDILFRGLFYPRHGTSNPYISERGVADYHLQLKGYRLAISGVKQSDMGIYVFEGRYLSKKAAIKMFLFIANVAVQTRPGEPYISVRGCVCEGKGVTLTCESDGMEPPVRLAWYHGERRLENVSVSHARHNHALVRSKLHVGPLSRADHGDVYRCLATNPLHPDSPATKRVRLRVQHAAFWNPKSPTTVAGTRGSSATLNCDVSSYPPPYRIEWYFRGRRVRKADDRISFRKKHRYMTIARLSGKDFGTYTCIAQNSRGKSKFRIQLKQRKVSPKTVDKNVNEVLDKKNSFRWR